MGPRMSAGAFRPRRWTSVGRPERRRCPCTTDTLFATRWTDGRFKLIHVEVGQQCRVRHTIGVDPMGQEHDSGDLAALFVAARNGNPGAGRFRESNTAPDENEPRQGPVQIVSGLEGPSHRSRRQQNGIFVILPMLPPGAKCAIANGRWSRVGSPPTSRPPSGVVGIYDGVPPGRVPVPTVPGFGSTLNWLIMSESSCEPLWQWNTNRPGKFQNWWRTVMVWFGPTQTVSLNPVSSPGLGARPWIFTILKRPRWRCTGWPQPPDSLTSTQSSVVSTSGWASSRSGSNCMPLMDQ